MDGVHDMGGMHGFGTVVEPGVELTYHERWEPRVFAIQMLVGVEGLGAGPGGRAVREEMDPARYLAASYYERWLYSAEQRLLRLAAGHGGAFSIDPTPADAGQGLMPWDQNVTWLTGVPLAEDQAR